VQRASLGTVSSLTGFTITVGERTFTCSDGRHTSERNKPDNASGRVGATDLAERGADWAGPAHVTIDHHDVMHGRIVEARPKGENLSLSVRSATMLSDSLLPPMVVQQIDTREVVYLAAREAGFKPEDIDIDGLADAARFEPLWVLAPLHGLNIRESVQVGVVELVTGDAGREMLLRFSPRLEAQFVNPLDDVEAFARVAVPAKYMCEAEREGLDLIDDAAAWLTTRLRYSWSHAPDGRLEPFERAAALTVVERLSGVAVLQVEGVGRRWWRETTAPQPKREVELRSSSRWLTPAMPTQVDLGDRQALLALQRAITARDPVQRVAALWEAIEFFLGDRSPEPEFTDEEIAAAVERATEGMTEAKSKRVGNVLRQWLNSWSPQARLEKALADESIPFTDEDKRRVRNLRKARNRALHGAESTPGRDEIDQVIGLMSRAMAGRWSRSTQT
jgi:hypothetical protein